VFLLSILSKVKLKWLVFLFCILQITISSSGQDIGHPEVLMVSLNHLRAVISQSV
jgi:hypothetical protein